MTSKERFERTVGYAKPDRPMISHIFTQPYILDDLCAYIGVKNEAEFLRKAGQDIVPCNPYYTGKLNTYADGSRDGIWGERYKRLPEGERVNFEEAVYLPYAGIEELSDIKKVRFPTWKDHDYGIIAPYCREHKDKAICFGSPGGLDFMNGTAFCRGLEQVYMDVGLEDPVYLYIIERRFEYFYETCERTLKEGGGLIDIVFVGEDLGTQSGPIISLEKFDRLFARYYKAVFDLAHRYGAKTLMHSCGSIVTFIDRLIELGLDILEGVQVDAKGMNIESLHAKYYKKLAFCGTISVQSILNAMTPQQVAAEVEKRKALFKDGGIIIGPSNVLQADTKPENFVAMCRAIGSYTE